VFVLPHLLSSLFNYAPHTFLSGGNKKTNLTWANACVKYSSEITGIPYAMPDFPARFQIRVGRP
jgi:hypothetical protein